MALEVDRAELALAIAGVRDLAERADHLDPFLRYVADDMRELSQDRFRSARWAPVTPEYAARKAREGKGRTVGRYTGGLERSLALSGDRYHRERITSDAVEVTTTNPVAHLFDGGRKRQPARDLNPRRELEARARRWADVLTRYLVTGRL